MKKPMGEPFERRSFRLFAERDWSGAAKKFLKISPLRA